MNQNHTESVKTDPTRSIRKQSSNEDHQTKYDFQTMEHVWTQHK